MEYLTKPGTELVQDSKLSENKEWSNHRPHFAKMLSTEDAITPADQELHKGAGEMT